MSSQKRSNKKSISFLVSLLLLIAPTIVNAPSASGAPKVVKPTVTTVKAKTGKTAITLNLGTQYAGKTVAITQRVKVGSKTATRVIANVRVGRDGRAVVITSTPIARGTTVQAKIGSKVIVTALVLSIPTV